MKEDFSPELVTEAMSKSSRQGDLILDPFSGSGTVALFGRMAKRQTVAIEVNPFLAFVAGVKHARVGPSEVGRSIRTVIGGIECGSPSPLVGFSTFTTSRTGGPGLFNEDVLTAFEGGWRAVDRLPKRHHGIFRLMLVKAAMENCNATRDGKALRYKPDLSAERFNTLSFGRSFERLSEEVASDLSAELPKGFKPTILNDDSRHRLRLLNSRFTPCVTSPPYLNSFDYTDVYRPELFLGKFITSHHLRQLRLKTIRSHVQAKWEDPHPQDLGVVYMETLQQVTAASGSLWNRRIPLMIQAYFEDMKSVFRDLKMKAESGAEIWMMVSTSAYAGVEIPVDLILLDIGQAGGWQVKETHLVRSLRSSGQHMKRTRPPGSKASIPTPLRETLLIFRNEPPKSLHRPAKLV